MSDLTVQWCRDNLQANGYETKEDSVSVEFVIAKCSNGSDAMVAFNTFRPSQKDIPKVFVANFYVEHVKDVSGLRSLVRALGFGNDKPWRVEHEIPAELYTPKTTLLGEQQDAP